MTTIAASLTQMSADTFSHTQVSGYCVNKIVRVGTTLVGCAGPGDWCNRFIEWRTKGGKPPKVGKAELVEALVLDKTGLYIFYNTCVPDRIRLPYFAIGSGRQYALGALAAGLGTDRAIEIACQFDPYSKPPTDTLVL
jgi:hypothetical protein